MITHNCKAYDHHESEGRKVSRERRPFEEFQQIVQRTCRFRHNSKYSYEDSSACNEDGSEDHPRREPVSKNEAGEECIPEQGYGTQRRKDDDGERSNLHEGSDEVRGDEYRKAEEP